MLATTSPYLIELYSQTTGSEQAAVAVIFEVLSESLVIGLFTLLENIPGGVWLIGIGVFLLSERKVIAVLSIVKGAGALINSLGELLESPVISLIGFMAYVPVSPVWSLWLGADLLLRPVQPKE